MLLVGSRSAPAGYITADFGTGGWRWGYGMFCVMFVRIHSLQLSSMADYGICSP